MLLKIESCSYIYIYIYAIEGATVFPKDPVYSYENRFHSLCIIVLQWIF